MKKKRIASVINGPSIWDLMLALFDGKKRGERKVSFTFAPYPGFWEKERVVEVEVTGVSRYRDDLWSVRVMMSIPEGSKGFTAIDIYPYSVKTRKGELDLTDVHLC